MGIDAEMFARIKGRDSWLLPAEELKAAYDLASALGHRHFMISAPGETYYHHHALSIIKPMDAETAAEYDVPQYAGKVVWTQDAEPEIAGPDEQFIKVHLYTRYYGEGYARGDWPTILMTAKWLELRFPGCEVWYGGDSSGVAAEPLTTELRERLTRLWLTSGTRTYHSAFGGIGGKADPVCTCPRCKEPMSVYGWGGGGTMHHCPGCGHHAVHARGEQHDCPPEAAHDENKRRAWENSVMHPATA